MRDQLRLGRILHGGEAEQAGVVAEVAGKVCLGCRLVGLATDAGDAHEGIGAGGVWASGVGAIELFFCEAQHGLKQRDLGSRMANWVVWTPTAIPRRRRRHSSGRGRAGGRSSRRRRASSARGLAGIAMPRWRMA